MNKKIEQYESSFNEIKQLWEGYLSWLFLKKQFDILDELNFRRIKLALNCAVSALLTTINFYALDRRGLSSWRIASLAFGTTRNYSNLTHSYLRTRMQERVQVRKEWEKEKEQERVLF